MSKPATQLEFLALCFELPDLSDASTPLPEWLPMILRAHSLAGMAVRG